LIPAISSAPIREEKMLDPHQSRLDGFEVCFLCWKINYLLLIQQRLSFKLTPGYHLSLGVIFYLPQYVQRSV
jgi:hypothetical protein